MELISEYLETYEGRDKCLRILSYTAKLATIFPKSNETASKFKHFGSQMASCRVIMRLLDDIPSIHYALTYGCGKLEPDQIIRWLEVMQITVDVIYSPIETIAWAGEHKLIPINIDRWDNASTWFWIVTLHISFIKTELKAIDRRRNNEILTCLRMLIDLGYAISYLPPGTLWGGKLSIWQVGALGTVSSLIGLYQSLSKRITLKKCT